MNNLHNGNANHQFKVIAGGLSKHMASTASTTLDTTPTAILGSEKKLTTASELYAKTMQDIKDRVMASDVSLSAEGAAAANVAAQLRNINLSAKSLDPSEPSIFNVGGKKHLMVTPFNTTKCARLLAKSLDLVFFAPGVGLVEVFYLDDFSAWSCSPLDFCMLAEHLENKVSLLVHDPVSGAWAPCAHEVYRKFAVMLAGTCYENSFFDTFKGMAFTGHMTNEGRVIKRSGFDKRSGLYVMPRKPFRLANEDALLFAD